MSLSLDTWACLFFLFFMFVLFYPEIKRRLESRRIKIETPLNFRAGLSLMELAPIWCPQDMDKDSILPLDIEKYHQSQQGEGEEHEQDSNDGGIGLDDYLSTAEDIREPEERETAGDEKGPEASDGVVAQVDAASGQGEKKKRSSKKKAAKKSIEWMDPDIRKFAEQYVYPNQKMFQQLNTWDTITQLLDFYEQHGGCSSVVKSDYDLEYKLLKNEYDNFKRITLREHAINTARQMIAIVQNADEEIGVQLGKLIIVALGHDIGKMPEFRNSRQEYMKADHAMTSATVVRSIIPPDLSCAKEVLRAIRNHQVKTDDKLTETLRAADQNAREYEARSISREATRGYSLILDEAEKAQNEKDNPESKTPQGLDLTWLNYDRLMDRLKEFINAKDVVKAPAFSMPDGTVYVMPVLITKAILEFASEVSGNEELVKIAESTKGKRDIEYSVVNIWRKRELVPEYVGQNYNGGKFELLDENDKCLEKGFYTPLKFEAFVKNLADLEQRKKGMEHLTRVKKIKRNFGH